MVDFINEVEEELRKDEYNKLLRRWGPYLLGVIVAIVAVTGYLEWQKFSNDRAARSVSAAFVDASNLEADGNLSEASRQFLAIAEKAPEGYAGLSYMRAAAIKLESGERLEAVRLFDKSADVFERPRHKQLAQIKAAYILANDGQYADVASRVASLAEKDQPYEFLARELLGFAALKTDDMPKARQEFSYLATIPGVPAPIQERAAQSMSLMKVDQAKVAAAAPQDATETPDKILAEDPKREEATDE